MAVVKINMTLLISGTDDEDHLKILSTVCETLQHLRLTLTQSKCKFYQNEVETKLKPLCMLLRLKMLPNFKAF